MGPGVRRDDRFGFRRRYSAPAVKVNKGFILKARKVLVSQRFLSFAGVRTNGGLTLREGLR